MAAPPPAPPRSYRSFLTPLLHQRFTNAAIAALAICYVEAVWMSDFDLLWSWFPIGFAGLRTALLFISVLAVFILRVAQLHLEPRLAPSPFQTFLNYGFRLTTLQTLSWYTFSAWFFCEVYIWSAPAGLNLAMVDPGRPYERPRLNDRPIYLRTMFLSSAVIQSLFHLYKDCDHVPFPAEKKSEQDQGSPSVRVQNAAWRCLIHATVHSLALSFAGLFAYPLLLRRTAWSWTLTIAKLAFNLPKHGKPPRLPAEWGYLIPRFLVEDVLLVFLWEMSNEIYTAYFAREPVKKGNPLTAESKDPNGSLLAGLKAKKELPKVTAFWELNVIAQRFQARRETIYTELDRAGGSTWSQILDVCIAELQVLSKRINGFRSPPPPPGLVNAAKSQAELQRLPRMSEPLMQENIIIAAPPPKGTANTLASEFGRYAKHHGQSPGAMNPASKFAKDAAKWGTDAVRSRVQDQGERPAAGFQQSFETYILQFLRNDWYGFPFRLTFSRRIQCIMFGEAKGSPFLPQAAGGIPSTSSASVLCDAAAALSKLTVCSLKEDKYGRVHRDVAYIIRTFSATISIIEWLVEQLPVDWTDVEMRDELSRVAPDALAATKSTNMPNGGKAVLMTLQDGLREVLNEFGEFQDELGLSSKEWREAKEKVRLPYN